MNQALHYAPLNSSRLVRFLSDLHVCAADYSTKDFGMRLSALIDFDSIVLSTALIETSMLSLIKTVQRLKRRSRCS